MELIDEGAPKPKKTEELSPGDSFGLKSLIFSTSVAYSARAVTHTDIFSFGVTDFVRALRDHPQAREKIQAITLKEYGKPLQV